MQSSATCVGVRVRDVREENRRVVSAEATRQIGFWTERGLPERIGIPQEEFEASVPPPDLRIVERGERWDRQTLPLLLVDPRISLGAMSELLGWKFHSKFRIDQVRDQCPAPSEKPYWAYWATTCGEKAKEVDPMTAREALFLTTLLTKIGEYCDGVLSGSRWGGNGHFVGFELKPRMVKPVAMRDLPDRWILAATRR